MTLGEKIKTLRREKHLTQQELAQAIGQNTRAYVAQLEGGTRKNINLLTLRRISETLGVSVRELLKDTEYHGWCSPRRTTECKLGRRGIQAACQ